MAKHSSVQTSLEKTPRAALAWFFGLLSVILVALVVSYSMSRSSETEVLGKTTNRSTPVISPAN